MAWALRRSRASALVVLSFACLSATLQQVGAQSHPAEQGSAPENKGIPHLRVSTHLVEVNVIVSDKHGNPITGLTQKDFSVFDDGRPQEIRDFSVETDAPATMTAAALPVGTYTNRPEEGFDVPPSVTVILLDALNTDAGDQALARQEVLRVLRETQPQDYVALYWLGDRLRILHDFTTNTGVLREVLAGIDNKSSRALDNSELGDPSLSTTNPSTPMGQAFERQAFRLAFAQREANESKHDRVRTTAAALTAIAHHLGSRRGRKNLVWVSGSFPISVGYDKTDLEWTNDTGEEFGSYVQQAARELNAADIAIYPVDARGLVVTDSSAAGTSLGDDSIDRTDGDTHVPTRAAPEMIDTMQVLAERTGGKAFYGTNNISGAIRRALEDTRVSYTLGYYPAATKWDGAFHEIKVKVGVPGAEVRSRSGYFAVLDSEPASSKGERTYLAELAASRIPATGIGLHVVTASSSATASGNVIVELHIDLREIHMQQRDNHWTGSLRSVFLQLDDAARVLQADDRTFHPEFDAPTYQRALQDGISDTRKIRVLAKARELCILVRDDSGKIGSIYLPLASAAANSASSGSPQK